jgi:hypothetical protein
MATPMTGSGRGGARRGAGRPKGRKDSEPRRNSALVTALPVMAERDQKLPLYRLLERIADPTRNERYKDTLCVALLPYMHSRMPSVMLVKPPHLMSDQELAETFGPAFAVATQTV